MEAHGQRESLRATLEQQADAVADRITGCRTEHPASMLQPTRYQAPPGEHALARYILTGAGRGRALPNAARGAMRALPAWSTDLARIHTDGYADFWCRLLGARAFTIGRDLYFAEAEFPPQSPEALHLLAHELVHVVQQSFLGFGADRPLLQCQVRFRHGRDPKPEEILREVKGYLRKSGFPTDRVQRMVARGLPQSIAADNEAGQFAQIEKAIKRMHDTVEDYGLVDLGDPAKPDVPGDRQQRGYFIAALCDLIRNPDRHPTTASSCDDSAVYELALVGRGASIAYYLNSLPPTYDHERTVLIGQVDPWRGDNPSGRGRGYINQQAQLIGYAKEQVPTFDPAYFDRDAFADETARIFAEAEIRTQVQDDVTAIRFNTTRKLFSVRTANGGRCRARKVVVGMGAGPHRVPGWAKQIRDEEANQKARTVMNLDEFMRWSFDHLESKNLAGKRIVVHGPNAAIDAVERAGACGIAHENIIWLVGRTRPVVLKGNQLEHVNELEKNAIRVKRSGFKIVRDKTTHKLTVTAKKIDGRTPEDNVHEENVDFYVFALGQDPMADGAVGRILSDVIVKRLRPIYDINQRLGDNPYETVLGLETRPKGTGCRLQVIGAAAYALAGTIPVRHRPSAETYTKNYLASLQPSLAQSNPNLAKQAQRFCNDYVEKGGLANVFAESPEKQEPEIRGQHQAREKDYEDIVKWVGDENEQRRVLVEKRIKEPIAGREREYRQLVERLLPWDHWLRGVNLLADMARGYDLRRQMDNQARTLAPSVIQAAQLGSIRSAMMALNATLPRYITRDANLIGDDRTQLQVFLLTRIMENNLEGELSPGMAYMLVEDFVTYRGLLEGYPYGFEADVATRVFDPVPYRGL